MKCIRCDTPNPEGQKFCGNCGAPLDPNLGPLIKEYLQTHLPQEIRAALKEQLQDQKVVEVETAEAIWDRLIKWTKYVAFVIGIPVAILAGVGVKSCLDLSKAREEIDYKLRAAKDNTDQLIDKVKSASEKIDRQVNQITSLEQKVGTLKTQAERLSPTLEKAEMLSKRLSSRGGVLEREYEKIEEQLAQIKTLNEKVGNLETTVQKIEEFIIFKPDAALTPEEASKLKSDFSRFRSYLDDLGFKSTGPPVELEVKEEVQGTAYYSENTIHLSRKAADDLDVAFREYTFHVLGALVKTPRSMNWGEYNTIASGFADYFPCSFSDDPLMAEKLARKLNRPYIRNLKNNRQFTELTQLRPERMYHDGAEIWGGAFWEIREALGQSIADKLLFSTWTSMQPSDFRGNIATNFVDKLLKMAQSSPDGDVSGRIRSVFERRGFKF